VQPVAAAEQAGLRFRAEIGGQQEGGRAIGQAQHQPFVGRIAAGRGRPRGVQYFQAQAVIGLKGVSGVNRQDGDLALHQHGSQRQKALGVGLLAVGQNLPDRVTLEHGRQRGHLAALGLGEDEHGDLALPERQAVAKRRQQPRRVLPAVDQNVRAGGRPDQDAVAVAGVQKVDVQPAIRQG